MIDFEREPSTSELRWFGVVVLAFFGIVGVVVSWQLESLHAAQILWGTGVALAAFYYAVRPLRRPFYSAWMRLVLPVGWVVSHVALGLVYYGILTPIALVMRVFGRDRLSRHIDRSAETYWTVHDPGGDTARYFRQT